MKWHRYMMAAISVIAMALAPVTLAGDYSYQRSDRGMRGSGWGALECGPVVQTRRYAQVRVVQAPVIQRVITPIVVAQPAPVPPPMPTV